MIFMLKGEQVGSRQYCEPQAYFLVIPMPTQQEEIFICPAEDRNLSEVVILVARHFYMEMSKYMQ